jgi:opacity protein-like surface antigen
MNKHIAGIFVILISMMSSTLFAQSSGINGNINRDIFNLSTKQSPKQEKSSATLSIGAGYAGTATKVKRPDGFDIQLDLIFPVTTYLAINGSINYARFPRYIDETRSTVNNGELTYVTLTPGLSIGNFMYNDKFNYFITTGFALGLGSVGKTIYSDFNGDTVHISSGGPADITGVLISGRISYKLSKQFQIYLEPSYYTVWSDDGKSNYHINGGVSLNL